MVIYLTEILDKESESDEGEATTEVLDKEMKSGEEEGAAETKDKISVREGKEKMTKKMIRI